jgi:hypothetical protein
MAGVHRIMGDTRVTGEWVAGGTVRCRMRRHACDLVARSGLHNDEREPCPWIQCDEVGLSFAFDCDDVACDDAFKQVDENTATNQHSFLLMS